MRLINKLYVPVMLLSMVVWMSASLIIINDHPSDILSYISIIPLIFWLHWVMVETNDTIYFENHICQLDIDQMRDRITNKAATMKPLQWVVPPEQWRCNLVDELLQIYPVVHGTQAIVKHGPNSMGQVLYINTTGKNDSLEDWMRITPHGGVDIMNANNFLVLQGAVCKGDIAELDDMFFVNTTGQNYSHMDWSIICHPSVKQRVSYTFRKIVRRLIS